MLLSCCNRENGDDLHHKRPQDGLTRLM